WGCAAVHGIRPPSRTSAAVCSFCTMTSGRAPRPRTNRRLLNSEVGVAGIAVESVLIAHLDSGLACCWSSDSPVLSPVVGHAQEEGFPSGPGVSGKVDVHLPAHARGPGDLLRGPDLPHLAPVRRPNGDDPRNSEGNRGHSG